MRIAYLDCFAGISGDMLLGALIDSGVPSQILYDATAALKLGATISVNKVDRRGISSTKVDVLDHGNPADAAHTRSADISQVQKYEHRHDENRKAQHSHSQPHTHHDHHHEHTHSHGHPHAHGRSLSVIRSMIQLANLPEAVRQTAIHTFELLGASEARIHNVDIEKIHFHEVGAVDAIVDIVAASAGIHALGIDAWYASPVNVGGGMVDCAHGCFPVPAPATADLLRDVPSYSAYVQQELVTPTGAALIRALTPTFGPQPAMSVQQIGYGAGSHNPKGFPNVLRLSIGEASGAQYSSVAILETAIDDLSPQILAHVTERALSLGALDVMTMAVHMKKGRLGTLITILADDANIPALEDLLLRETTTLGVRIHHERRSCLDRSHAVVNTDYGDIRIKLGTRLGEILNAAPEFEDCRAAAAQHNVPVKHVQQAAIAAYYSSRARSE